MSDPQPWAPPLSIDRPSVPVFPVHVLPEPLRSWCIATAEATQTPVDLAALLALAICSGTVARRVEIEAGKGWIEPVNLYGACVLEPANRKSAVFRSATDPIRALEKEQVEEALPDIARRQSERRIKEAKQRAAEKRASTTGCPDSQALAQVLAEELAMEPVPVPPRLIMDDATAEAIEIALSAQSGRLIVAGCEGGLFDVMAGRYAAGMGNFDCFLKGHSGDDLRVDRVTRGSIVVEHSCLTLAYAVQPEVIRGLAAKPSFRGRGLIGRFMYAVPESPLGRRRIDPEPVPNDLTLSYASLIRRLSEIQGKGDGPQVLRLATDANSCFRQWQVEVEKMLANDGQLELLRDWGGKLCGLTARLAAVIHLIANYRLEPWRDPVELASLESAIEISRWAIPHTEAMLSLLLGDDGASDDARYILRWIRKQNLPSFSRRDAHNHGRQRFDREPERLDNALTQLIDCGWIRPMAGGLADGPGRPPSPVFEVNPEAIRPTVRARGVI